MDLLNASHIDNQPAFPGQAYGAGNKITLEQVDPSTFDDDSDDDDYGSGKGHKHTKKTRGRVKIKMEFIENKLRRYTTFSKRKTGIMKKAYELSTLTGTQVMLLVASETGHVYTFATRKLQPMITSESGKALIQTCLNSPDPPPIAPGQQQAVEQRMNPGGFEETELTYAVEEENSKEMSPNLKPLYSMGGAGQTTSDLHGFIQQQAVTSQPTLQVTTATETQQQLQHNPATLATVIQDSQSQQNIMTSTAQSKNQGAGSISVQLPGLPPGFILQPVQAQQTTQQAQQQTVYTIPAPTQQIISMKADTGQQQSNGTSVATVVSSQSNQAAMTPSVFMYQTPQGIVYAPANGTLQDKAIFSFQQSPQTITQTDATGKVGQAQMGTQGAQQIITIPVPASLTGSQQVLQLAAAETPPRQEVPAGPTGAKKRKV